MSFKGLNPQTDVYTDDIQIVTGLFSNGSGTLTSIFTASLSASDSQYYDTVQDAQGSTGVEYLDVTYGHSAGSGSDISAGVNNSYFQTKAIYRQFAGAFLDDPTEDFQFHNITVDGGTEAAGTNFTESAIYVTSVKSAKFKDRIDPKFTIQLSASTHSTLTDGTVATDPASLSGSIRLYTAWTGSVFNNSTAGRYYPIVTGSSGTPHETTTLTTYGWFYENYGTMIWNHTNLSASLNGPIGETTSGSTAEVDGAFNVGDHAFGFAQDTRTDGNAKNHKKMVNALKKGGSIKLKTVQDLAQTTYYCRAFHNEFNHTNNETMVNQDSQYADILEDFQENPVTYVTTIGLYNNSGDLIAVAKLNKPQKKDQNTEVTFAVKVNG
tara:strand:+ start:796 stop:1935 length:1140 start_codon:yes stop_codon:yes gene_type:complete